jgi:hypothetical protein
MAIDKIIKSNRLLQSRRYTVASLTDAQEAFTSVLDINSKEVYAQANLLPTSSLPFSGSSQNGNIYSVGGQNLLKYWYQQTLTPSSVLSGSRADAWFFLDPSGSSVTPQIIQTGQQNNFISNKYASPALSSADAESSTPGYNVVVLINGEKQNAANYQFDYKNGVLQFNIDAPLPSQTVKVTAYQYVGQTVDTTLTNLSASIASISGSLSNISQNKIVEGTVTASVSSGSNSFTLTSGSNALFTVRNNGQTNISGPLNVTGSINGLLVSTGNGNVSSNVSIGSTTAFGSSNTGGSNTAIGSSALSDNTTGTNNTAIGRTALAQNTIGGNNTAIGRDSLISNTTGNYNTAIGFNSLRFNTIGNNNTGIGRYSLYNNTTGGDNTAFGYNSGRFIADGSTSNTITNSSIFIGRNTRALGDNQTNQIVIGDDAIGLGSNTVVLGNDSIITTALRGNVGIGTTSPAFNLDVLGSGRFTGGLTVTGSLIVTSGITGSLFGTSSFATSASFARSASFAINAANSISSSFATNSTSASFAISSSIATSASFATVVGGISSNITNNTDNRILTATGGDSINGESNLTFNGSLLTVTGNAVITNNLTVQGTASFQSTTNLEVADRFIVFASGSNTAGDGGIVIQQGIQDVGELLGFDNSTTRWAFTSSFNAANSNFIPDAFVTATVIGTGTVPTAAPARYQATGNIFIGTDEAIWIYS